MESVWGSLENELLYQRRFATHGVTARSVGATATVMTRARPRADVEAGLAGLPLCFARANPRANHSHQHTRR